MTPLTRRRLPAVLTALTAGLGLALSALVVAPAASAIATSASLVGVQPTGLVGVPQNLQVSVVATTNCQLIGPMPPTVTIYGNLNGTDVSLGAAQASGCQGANYLYTYQWVPSGASVWYVYAVADTTQSNASRSAISPIPTVTVVNAASTVKIGQATTVSATVTAQLGAVFSPQGTVTFAVQGGGTIGTAALNQAVPSVAQISWTPAALGATNIVATYTPANNGLPNQNTTCGASCTSAPDLVQVTSSGVNMYLANPPAFAAGVPATLAAVISVVPPSGVVTFTVNGSAIAVNVPVQSNGQATTTWTPPAAGSYTIGASWTGNGNVTGTASEVVGVSSAPAAVDQIIVRTSTGTTLTPNATYQVGNGTEILFSSATASGATATFTETGPCTITQSTFTANQGSGQCRVTATSPGGNGYGPATATVTVVLIPGTQTAKLAAPASGKVNAGKTITLEKASQGTTSANQPITWKITKGNNSICSLVFANNGAVKLKMKKKGYCTVQAKAPGVANQWAKFVQTYQYQGI